jgi:uncharacterized coiled-coil protein SlyX
MDITQIQGLIYWVVGIFGVGLVSLVASVYAIIRSKKMFPKELKGADLSNESKEADIAKLYKGLATETALETIEVNKRLNALEDKVDVQEEIIRKQANTITTQSERLDLQDIKIEEQSRTISILECKLNNSEQYNKTLIEQMRRENLTPMSSVNMGMVDCDKISKQKNNRRGNDNV